MVQSLVGRRGYDLGIRAGSVPLLLGEGVRFYDAPAVRHIAMERTLVHASGQKTDLRFRVLK
jgi:hypothetical protein